MKKFLAIFIVGIMIICCGCSAKAANSTLNMSNCRQPGSYFPDENRYVLVDQSWQDIGGETYWCKVFADKYMYTMYLWIDDGEGYCSCGGLTQIFYEDGSPMIYDDETLDMEMEEEGY